MLPSLASKTRRGHGPRRRTFALATGLALIANLSLFSLPQAMAAVGCNSSAGTLTVIVDAANQNVAFSLSSGALAVANLTGCDASPYSGITTLNVSVDTPGSDEWIAFLDVTAAGWPATINVDLGDDGVNGDVLELDGANATNDTISSIAPVDTIASVEEIQVYGLDGDDTLNFSRYAGVATLSVYAGNGDDRVTGSAGDDDIYGGNGDDTLSAGAGADFVVGDCGGPCLMGDDVIDGGSGDDDLYGDRPGSPTGGTDEIYGRAGEDTIFGNGGEDLIEGGKGADALYGGDDADTVSYAASTRPVFIDLTVVDPTAQSTSNAGDAMGDTLAEFENVRGSGRSDSITGDAYVNYLYGERGRDLLYGGGEDDYLFGGSGADTADGEGGAGDQCEGFGSLDRQYRSDTYLRCESDLI